MQFIEVYNRTSITEVTLNKLGKSFLEINNFTHSVKRVKQLINQKIIPIRKLLYEDKLSTKNHIKVTKNKNTDNIEKIVQK